MMVAEKAGGILFAVFVAITLLLAFFVGFLLLTGTKAFAVESNSMSPVINKGDAVFVRSVAARDLRENDIISVKTNDNSGVFTHRIVKIDTENSLVFTKGDANQSRDPKPAAFSQIIGRLWFAVPYAGWLSLTVTNKESLIALAAAAMALVFVRVLLTAKKKKTEVAK